MSLKQGLRPMGVKNIVEVNYQQPADSGPRLWGATYFWMQPTVFRWINAPGTEAEIQPYSCLIAVKFTVSTPEYPKIMCWKFD